MRECDLQCDLKCFFYPLIIGAFDLNLIDNTRAKEEVFLTRKMLLFPMFCFFMTPSAIPQQSIHRCRNVLYGSVSCLERQGAAGLVLVVLQKMVVIILDTTVMNALQTVDRHEISSGLILQRSPKSGLMAG